MMSVAIDTMEESNQLCVCPDGSLHFFDTSDNESTPLKQNLSEYIESIRDGLISNKLLYDDVNGIYEVGGN